MVSVYGGRGVLSLLFKMNVFMGQSFNCALLQWYASKIVDGIHKKNNQIEYLARIAKNSL